MESVEGLICVSANDMMFVSNFDHTSLSFFLTLSNLQTFLEVGSPSAFSKCSLRMSIGLRESRLPWVTILNKGVEPERLFMQGFCAATSMF